MPGIWLKTSNREIGPLKPLVFERLVKKRKINSRNLVWSYKEQQWLRLAEVADFEDITRDGSEGGQQGKVVAVGGSKGGVGKTGFIASLAIELACSGRKVIAVDADFSDPDLNEWLGLGDPALTVSDFFTGKRPTLARVVLPTSIDNLGLICGDAKSIVAANPHFSHRRSFARHLKELPGDFVLVDLGPGSSYTNIDLFLACDDKILVTTPEPSSILSSVRFLRIAFIRLLKRTFKFNPSVLRRLMAFENRAWRRDPPDFSELLQQIERADSRCGIIFKSAICRYRPRIVLNMVMDQKELREGRLLTHALAKLFLIRASYLGFIKYDPAFRKAAKEKRPFLMVSESPDAAGEPVDFMSGQWLKQHLDRMLGRNREQILSHAEPLGRPAKSVVQNLVKGPMGRWPREPNANHITSPSDVLTP